MGIALVGFVQTGGALVRTLDRGRVQYPRHESAGGGLVPGLLASAVLLRAGAPARPRARQRAGDVRELRRTFRAIRRYREIVEFLIARLVFNDGLVTVFAFGGIYAAGTFGMSLRSDPFGVALNVASGLGAVAFGFLDDAIGGKKTIMLTLVGLTAATALAVWAPNARGSGWPAC